MSILSAFIGSGGEFIWLPERPQLDPELTRVRDRYDQVGRHLARNQVGYVEICRVLRSIRDTSESNSPFVVIDAPSGTGKTQLGFTLSHLDFQVLHCTLHPSLRDDQTVYRTMENVSANIDKAVKADTLGITNPYANDLQVEALCRHPGPLRLVQYFFRYFLNDAHRPWDECTVSVLRTAFDNQPGTKKTPVVVVDEVGNNRSAGGEVVDSDILRVQYIRNLCRALRVPCVLMGTNSNAMNMIPAAAGSRTSGRVARWCPLIAGLPRVIPESQEALELPSVLTILLRWGHPALASVLAETSTTANPLFLVALVDGIQSVTEPQWQQWGNRSSDVLDDLLATMATRLFQQKGKLLTPAGQHGQFALQLNMYRGWETPRRSLLNATVLDTTRAVFVASHFATLDAPRAATDLFVEHGTLKCNLEANDNSSNLYPWMPSASFPTATSDPWLYMLCGGGKGHGPPAFRAKAPSGAAMSTADALTAIGQQTTLARQQPLEFSNQKAQVCDGDVLEVLVGVAMVTASRRNGVGGMSFSHFLCRLAEELILSSDINKQRATVTWRGEPLADGWLGELLTNNGVPFLGALNADWPASLLGVPGCHFGHCRRSMVDAENVVLSVSARRPTLVPSGVAEVVTAATAVSSSTFPSSPSSEPVEDVMVLSACNNYSAPLNQAHIKKILQRAVVRHRNDARHHVHLVFASKLGAKPYKSSSWETWKAKNATNVHLQVARLVVARDEAVDGLPSVSLSMANLSATMPRPHAGCMCDLLVLFIAVEDWLSVLQPTMLSKQVQSTSTPAESDEEEDETTTPASKKARKG